MKRIFFVAVMLSVAVAGFCQEVIRYPFTCYMEWPMEMPLDSGYHCLRIVPNLNGEGARWAAFGALPVADIVTRSRLFYVDRPTTIYGIAMVLWGQDSARRDFNVVLHSFQSSERSNLVKKMRWRDSLPVRRIVYEASQCGREDNIHYIDTATAYEFYFDTPFVAIDSFLVGYHTLGVDGLQHQSYQHYDVDSTGYVYRVFLQSTCFNKLPRPIWYSIFEYGGEYRLHRMIPLDWSGLLPIIQAPCKLDSLTCAQVPDMVVVPLDSSRVEFSWESEPGQQDYQIAIGRQGTPPELCHLFDASASPLILTDEWDTTATYVAYIRARCHHVCHPYDTVMYSEWSVPVLFFGYQPSDPIGIVGNDGQQLFTLTPNPARGTVAVRMSAYWQGATLTIRDAAGREVYRTAVESPSLVVPLQGYPAGTYMVTLTTKEGSSTQRLVVE